MPHLLRFADAPLVDGRRDLALALLSAAERARFESDPHAERFLAGRMLLRELIAELAGIPLERVRVRAACPDCDREHGQPIAELPGIHVSLSHAGRRTVAVAVAVASADASSGAGVGAAIGVDLESRDVTADRLAAIHELTGDEGLAHWTAVEAVLKADGRGLRVDPREVRVDGARARLDGRVYRLIDASDDEFVVTVAESERVSTGSTSGSRRE